MTVKKTTAKGPLFNYLGHFRKQKFLDQGHNINFTTFGETFLKVLEGPLGRIFPQASLGHGFKGKKTQAPQPNNRTEEEKKEAHRKFGLRHRSGSRTRGEPGR